MWKGMGMFKHIGIALLGAATAVMQVAMPSMSRSAMSLPLDERFRPVRPKGKGRSNRRGKGKVSAPKKRPNRLHMSRRVRRKHRKAA